MSGLRFANYGYYDLSFSYSNTVSHCPHHSHLTGIPRGKCSAYGLAAWEGICPHCNTADPNTISFLEAAVKVLDLLGMAGSDLSSVYMGSMPAMHLCCDVLNKNMVSNASAPFRSRKSHRPRCCGLDLSRIRELWTRRTSQSTFPALR